MIFINGMEAESLPVTDRGLQYGDGLFETIAVRAGEPLLWTRHMRRLQEGCSRLQIPRPEMSVLEAEATRVCAGVERGVLKILVTRGSGGRGYRPPQACLPTRIVALHPWPEYPEDCATRGVRVRICSTRLGLNPALAGLKHLNRLEQVLARGEWDDPHIAEGLMLDGSGRIIEGTMSNVFVVQDGRVLTPDLSCCGVAGIMRGMILESCERLSIPCRIGELARRDLERADEVFLTNSLIGVWPVTGVENCGDYPVGPITRRLAEAVSETRD